MSSGYFQVPQPMRSDGAGGIDKGPRDIMRDLENPDMLVPPTTDAGLIPNLRFSFSDTHMTLNQGGWSREITVRELPIATTMAGVNMSLTPGGVRELHWHQQAEWSYMLLGHARITAVDQNGCNIIADVGPGDLWYFPPGIPHSIQGLAGGCEFLLVFDDGNFSIHFQFQIGLLIRQRKCCQRTLVYRLVPLTIFRVNRCIFIKTMFLDRLTRKKFNLPMVRCHKPLSTVC